MEELEQAGLLDENGGLTGLKLVHIPAGFGFVSNFKIGTDLE